jgi:hypothetical protein
MWEEYYKLLTETFPSLSPDFSDRYNRIIREIQPPSLFFFYDSYAYSVLLQGDIIGPISFFENKADGCTRTLQTDALVITNTCDLIRKKRILLCPALPLNESSYPKPDDLNSIRRNLIFERLYLPAHNATPEYIIDLSRTFNVDRESLITQYNNGIVQRKLSLSKEG